MTKMSKRKVLIAFCASVLACVCCSAVNLKTASAETTESTATETQFYMSEGAAVRVVKDSSGIRWETNVSETWYTTLETSGATVEFHTLVTAAKNVSNIEQLTYDDALTENSKVKDLLAPVTKVSFTEGVFTYYGAIVYDQLAEEYKTAAYATDLIARSYISITSGDSVQIIYATANDTVRSIRAVANAVVEDTEEFAKFDEVTEQPIIKGYLGTEGEAFTLNSEYHLEESATLTMRESGEYTVAYAGSKKVGTVLGATVTFDANALTLGETYALTLFDGAGNYAKVAPFKYVTKTISSETELSTYFPNNAAIGTGYYVLTDNITLTTWRARSSNSFAGTLDGQGYSINALPLYYSTNKQYARGFFYSLLDGAVIKNIAMTNVEVTTGVVGVFAYTMEDGASVHFENVYVSFKSVVAEATYSAGLIATLSSGQMRIIAENVVIVVPESSSVTSFAIGYVAGTGKTLSLKGCTFIGGDGETLSFEKADSGAEKWTLNGANEGNTVNDRGGNIITTKANLTSDMQANWSQMQKNAYAAELQA